LDQFWEGENNSGEKFDKFGEISLGKKALLKIMELKFLS